MGALAGPLTSIIGSLMLGASTAAIGWLVHKNIIAPSDASADASALGTYLTTGALGVVTIAIIWFKGKLSTRLAHIQAVNAGDNGAKVVKADVNAPTVTAPVLPVQAK